MDPTTFEIDNDDNDVEFVKVETIKPKVNKVGIKLIIFVFFFNVF